jgi:toxin ParE1/3/4
VTHIQFSPEVADDIDRTVDHLLQHDVRGTHARIEGIIRAVDVLEHNPLIGRRV